MASAPKKPRGGQTTFDPAKAGEICELISYGQTTNSACKAVGLPRQTFIDWVMADRDGLAVKYARARDSMFDVLADEIIDIAKDTTRDRTNIPVNRDRLITDNTKWLLSKLRPEKYGERLEVKQNTTINTVKDDPETIELAKSEWTDMVPKVLNRRMDS